MERDGYLFLKPYDNYLKYLIEIPFYFLYTYNAILNIVPGVLHNMFQIGSKVTWEDWEIFIAQFESFRNNLFFDTGTKETTLRELYRGAIGKKSVLDIKVRFKKLDVCDA